MFNSLKEKREARAASRTEAYKEQQRLDQAAAAGAKAERIAAEKAHRANLRKGITPMIRATDAYANNTGANISFEHVPSGNKVAFKAFITAFNETYSSDWSNEIVFGRIDPIYLYKNTMRKISLAFKIPAESAIEASNNLSNVQALIQYLYPNYTTLLDSSGTQAAQTISQSPMIRLKVMNLLQDTSTAGTFYAGEPVQGRGQLGIISSFTVNHNLEGPDGVLHSGHGVILPKLIEVNVDFSPIHEHPIGWNEKKRPFNSHFPYAQPDLSFPDALAGAGTEPLGADPGLPAWMTADVTPAFDLEGNLMHGKEVGGAPGTTSVSTTPPKSEAQLAQERAILAQYHTPLPLGGATATAAFETAGPRRAGRTSGQGWRRISSTPGYDPGYVAASKRSTGVE